MRQGPSFFEGAPVTKALLIANAAILFLQVLLTGPGERLFLSELGEYSIAKGVFGGQVWRFVTFQFLHANFGHLLMNSIGLFFFGPHIERWMSSRPYLVYYLLCGVAGALLYTFLFFVPGIFDGYDVRVPMVGASAGLFGILAAFYFVAPDARVLLFFVIPMKVRTLAVVYFWYETMSVLFNWHNAGGSAGHLGGALFGLLVLKWPPLKDFVVRLSRVGTGAKKKARKRVQEATIVRENKGRGPIELSREVDRILDKISEHGIQSITEKEREILNRARRDR